jgi:RNA recognition motif-containing protein
VVSRLEYLPSRIARLSARSSAAAEVRRFQREVGFVERRDAIGKKTPDEDCVSMKLYVGNLPYSTTEEDLRTLFSQYGTVDSVAVITDRDTGRSKGFGFVEFSDDNEARNAIQGLSGQEFSGRALTVNEARPKTGGGGGGRGYGGGRDRY